MSRHPRLVATVIPFIALAGLTACSGGGANVGSEPPASFTGAPWATEVDPQGEWLTSIASDDVRLDVYQAGVADAPDDSAWVYNDSDEPLFEAGDPILVLEYVLTNTGDAQLVLPSGKPDITPNYTSLDLASVPAEERFGEVIESFGIAADTPIDHDYTLDNDFDGLTGNWDMPVEPGESVAWAEVYLYLPDGGFTIRFRVWPYEDGDFDFGAPVFDSDDVKVTLK